MRKNAKNTDGKLTDIVETKETMKLGSLFDGIGGFPYAASFYGIKTLWASEIIPAAVSVTRRHFPDMEHVGDITKLNGGTLDPVHIITFGSPCQSFSIAGQRKGLEGKSGLFWEAIRIIKEMREATNGQWPQYCVFENVPGILSANRGRDYKTVLEAFTEAEIPLPPSGRWTNAGMVRGGRIDVAWVIHDAQHFGVAQRRRRLFAVCDFTGQRAAEILFKPKSLYRYFAQGGAAGKGTAPYAAGGVDSTERTTAGGSEITSTLYAAYGTRWNGNAGAYSGNHFVAEPVCVCEAQINTAYSFDSLSSNSMKSKNPHSGCREVDVAKTIDTSTPCPSKNQGGIAVLQACESRLARTHNARGADADEVITKNAPVVTVINDQGGDSLTIEKTELSPTLRSEAHGNLPIVSMKEAYPINTQIATRHIELGKGTGVGENGDPAYTLQEAHGHAVAANTPDTIHPQVTGTLCASGAGLSRPAGMANETDLCIVVPDKKAIPIQDKATRYSGGGDKRKGDGAGNGLGIGQSGDPAPTITSGDRHAVAAYCLQGNMIGRRDKNGPQGDGVNDNISFTLNTADRHAVAAFDCRNLRETEEISGTLQAKSTGSYSLNYQNPIRNGFVVRRLTPVECERLQGYPDSWTEYGHDGKPLCDTARYQALGNSVAIPCVAYVLSGIADEFYSL